MYVGAWQWITADLTAAYSVTSEQLKDTDWPSHTEVIQRCLLSHRSLPELTDSSHPTAGFKLRLCSHCSRDVKVRIITTEAVRPGASVSPHGVEERAVVNQSQQLVGRRHVVGHRLLPVVEEGVGSPDLTGEQVVQGENLHRSVELESLVPPALAEEDVDGVLLENTGTNDVCVTFGFSFWLFAIFLSNNQQQSWIMKWWIFRWQSRGADDDLVI